MTAADLPAVGRTALGVARVRAAESARDDRLFDDLRSATDAGCRQIVLLGAGLDSRAWRLDWPAATRLFEVDLPAVLRTKGSVLDAATRPPRCTRVEVPTDLAGDWRNDLLDAGFDRDQPTAWLAEGLLVYFDAEQADRLLRVTGDLSAPGSRIALERGDVARSAPADLDAATALWRGGLGRNPAAWLAEHGWTPVEHELSDLAATYHRTLPAQTASGFVSAQR
jgi:methyltransferase (TIGR00027 family)